MKKVEILEEVSDYKITNKDIQAIEEYKQCELPQDYREFLLQSNGGEPLWDVYEIPNYFTNGKSNHSSVDFFYGICKDTKAIMYLYDIFGANEGRAGRFPDVLFLIANSSGDELCMCVKGKDYGKIYFWDHEEEVDEGEEPWWDNVYFVANSFTEFLNSLYQADLNDDRTWTYRYQDGRMLVSKVYL